MTSGKLPVPVELVKEVREALELRAAGVNFSEIAKHQGTSTSTAWRRVQSGIAATLQEPADELRRLETERLDRLFRAMYTKAIAGSARHAEIAMRLMERRARLLGLDAPEKRIVNVITEDAIDQEIRKLEAELAANDPDRDGDRGAAGEAGTSDRAAEAAG